MIDYPLALTGHKQQEPELMADEPNYPPIGTAQNAADVARNAEQARAVFEEAFDGITGDLTELFQRLKATCNQSDWNYSLHYHGGDGMWDLEAGSGQPLAKPIAEGLVDVLGVKNAPSIDFAVRSMLAYMQIYRLA